MKGTFLLSFALVASVISQGGTDCVFEWDIGCSQICGLGGPLRLSRSSLGLVTAFALGNIVLDGSEISGAVRVPLPEGFLPAADERAANWELSPHPNADVFGFECLLAVGNDLSNTVWFVDSEEPATYPHGTLWIRPLQNVTIPSGTLCHFATASISMANCQERNAVIPPVSPETASTSTLGFEPFAYSEGDLAEQAGGFGFRAPWKSLLNSDTKAIARTGFSPHLVVQPIGGTTMMTYHRELETALGGANYLGPIYLSTNITGGYPVCGFLHVGLATSEQDFILGVGWDLGDHAYPNWGIFRHQQGTSDMLVSFDPVSAFSGQEMSLVLRIDFSPVARVRLYLNATSSSEPVVEHVGAELTDGVPLLSQLMISWDCSAALISPIHIATNWPGSPDGVPAPAPSPTSEDGRVATPTPNITLKSVGLAPTVSPHPDEMGPTTANGILVAAIIFTILAVVICCIGCTTCTFWFIQRRREASQRFSAYQRWMEETPPWDCPTKPLTGPDPFREMHDVEKGTVKLVPTKAPSPSPVPSSHPPSPKSARSRAGSVRSRAGSCRVPNTVTCTRPPSPLLSPSLPPSGTGASTMVAPPAAVSRQVKLKPPVHVAPLPPRTPSDDPPPALDPERFAMTGKQLSTSIMEALDSLTGNNVAIQVIVSSSRKAPSCSDSNATRSDMLADRLLPHPHLVEVIGTFRSANHDVHVVTELMPTTLWDIVQNCPNGILPIVALRRYLVHVLQAVSFLHKRDICQLDIRPENILVGSDDDDVAKLARSYTVGKVIPAPCSFFMAPEVIASGKSCKASDVWAIGLTVMTLSTGVHPSQWFWQSDSTREPSSNANDMLFGVIFQLTCAKALPPYPQTLTGDVLTFVTECLHFDPTKRPAISDLMRSPLIAIL